MEHYITGIEIENLRHLSNIKIDLNSDERQHLLLTGKNGSGKTTVLLAICKYLRAINEGRLTKVKTNFKRWYIEAYESYQNAKTEQEKFECKKEYEQWKSNYSKYCDGLELEFNQYEDLDAVYQDGKFVIAYFSADRKTTIIRPTGVENIQLADRYSVDDDPGRILLKYMVHLKTQQSYARNENDIENAERIQKWFDRFENALKQLLDDETIQLKYNYKEYEFQIIEQGKEAYGFDQLSDGYSSLIHMVSDLILRMDKNWILTEGLSEYNVEGIVLIDELETHLHIELQKKILPFLTEFFPRIQFIVTTHSPYILNSIPNAKAYDLEKHIVLEHLSAYSSEDLAEAYFDADEYSEVLKEKLMQYSELMEREDLTDDERAVRAELRSELGHLSNDMSMDVKILFDEIERRRKSHG